MRLGACRVLGALEPGQSFADLPLSRGFSHGRANGEPDVRGICKANCIVAAVYQGRATVKEDI